MKTVILGSQQGSVSNSGVTYTQVSAGNAQSGATEANFQQVIAIPGTIKNLYVELTSSPGSGKSYTSALMVNGVATALSVAIADSATTGNDTADSIAVNAGDLISLRITPSGTPTASTPRYGVVFEAGANESIILGGSNTNPSKTAPNYYGLQSGSIRSWSATQAEREQIITSAGVISRLLVKLN